MDKTFKQKLEILPIKNIQHPVGNTKYYAAVHVKSLIEQADEEIADLKYQMQQQPLPVLPEFVAGGIESIPRHYSAYAAISLIKDKIKTFPEGNEDWVPVYKWLFDDINNQDVFALAFITRKYQVEKPQLFYLKSKSLLENEGESEEPDVDELYLNAKGNLVIYKGDAKKFTQAEIDSMETGSYEQIEVAE